jgi:predicted amidohydrolase
MPRTTIVSVAMQVANDPDANLTAMLLRIREAAELGADLVVFPEQALQGRLPDMHRLDFDGVRYQQRTAEVVPTGLGVRALVEAAVEQSLHVVFGVTERDGAFADVLYDTAVLAGPDGYIGRYRKVHPFGDERHLYSAGDVFPVFETSIGRIGLLVCPDGQFPETTRALALQGAEILVVVTGRAYADPATAGDGDRHVEQDDLIGRVRAFENQTWLVESNLVDAHGRLVYHGHSRVIDPNGVVVADTGPAEGMAVATVDVADTIQRARGADNLGAQFLKDYVPVPASLRRYGTGTD